MKRLLIFVLISVITVFSAVAGAQSEGTSQGSTGQAMEKPTLKFLTFYQSFDINNDPAKAVIEKATGYEFEVYMLPAERANEKLNLDMSSGVVYDMMSLSKTQFSNLLGNNVLMALDDLIATHGPNVEKAIEEKTWSIVISDGKRYGLPGHIPMNYISNCLGVRKDLLDQLSLKTPQTLDEFYSTLKALKDELDIIPYTTILSFEPTIASAFGLSTYWEDVNGTLVPRIKLPGMTSYLAFMAKLYEEGLLDSEMPVNKRDTIRQKFASGNAGVVAYSWGEATRIKPALAKTLPAASIDVINALSGPNGEREISAVEGIERIVTVQKIATHAADVIMCANQYLDPENFRMCTIGIEGVHYRVENGKYFPNLPTFNELNNSNIYRMGVVEKDFGNYWQARVRKKPDMIEAFELIMRDADVRQTDPTGFAPTLERTAKYLPSLQKMESDYMVKVIAGSEDLADIAGFLDEWNKAGGEEMVAEVNAWYRTQK